MPTLTGSYRLLLRHRHLTALVVLTLAVGVGVPTAHTAAPRHREYGGGARLCIEALSIAALAALARDGKRSASAAVCPAYVPIIWRDRPVSANGPAYGARAGPAGRLVLRR